MSKKTHCILFGALLLFCACFAHAQIRYDFGGGPAGAGVATTSGTGLPFLLAVPNATVALCNYPANASPCTNFITTYTDLTLATPCPTNTQIVLQGSSTCQATTDNFGNGGFYIANSGTYSITVTVNGVSSIPYTITIGGSGGSPSSTNVINPTTCPAQTDSGCFPPSIFTNNTLVHVTSGTYVVTNGIQVTNDQGGGLLCDPGVLFVPALTAQPQQMLLVLGGSKNFFVQGCDIGGLSSTQGTVAVTASTATVTGTGTAFNSNMVGGSIVIFGGVDNSSTHGIGGCITAVSSATSLTIGNTGLCGGALPATYGGSTVTAAQYHISYGPQYAVKVTSQVCSIASISGTGSLVTVVTSNGSCALNTGQTVGIYGTGVVGGGSYNQQLTPQVTVISGCGGLITPGVCTFTYPSTLSLGTGTNGSVGIGPSNVRVIRNHLHDVTQQAISLASDSTDPNDSSYDLTAEDNLAEWTGATGIIASRMSTPFFSGNVINHPDMKGGGGGCIDFQQVKGGSMIGNDCGVFTVAGSGSTGPGLHSAFGYGNSFGPGNRVHDIPASSSLSSAINAHLDTNFNSVVIGNNIGQMVPIAAGSSSGLATQGNISNSVSGGPGIRLETCQSCSATGNTIFNVGAEGIIFNARLEATGSQTNGNASCVVAGCGTPSGHQCCSFDDLSSHSFTFTSTGANSSAGITASVPNLSGGTACTSATTPACVTDTGNKIEGAASMKLCPVAANCLSSPTQSNFAPGLIFYIQLDCTSGGGLCVGGNPSNTNLLTLPVFRFAIAGPTNRAINAGDFQIGFSSLPGCVDPEVVMDVPLVIANQFSYFEITPVNWQGWWDVPGVRCVGLFANPAGANAYTNIWIDDWAFDVPGRKAANVISSNTIFKPMSGGIVTAGGSNNFSITGNSITDPGWDNTSAGANRYGIDVDNSFTGSNLIKGNPLTGCTISGNSGYLSQLGGPHTFIGLNAYNGGAIDSCRADYSGCVIGQWDKCFDPEAGTIFATNYTPLVPLTFAGSCSGVGTSSTTIYLNGLGVTGAVSTCTGTTANQSAPVPRPGTVGSLVCSATAAGTSASSGVVTVQKDGSNTSMTCTFGTTAACSDTTQAHDFAVVPSDSLRINFTTQATETLAGVSCTVTEF